MNWLKQKRVPLVVAGIAAALVLGLLVWRTINVNTYQSGFHIQITNETDHVIRYLAFGALDPVHEFTDIAPGETIRTHVDSMGGENVTLFARNSDGLEEKTGLMYVMSKNDVHMIEVLIAEGGTEEEALLQVESLDGSLIMPWWIRRLYAYRTTELPLYL